MVNNKGKAMSLDNFQRITVETVRRHKGQISIMLIDGADKTAIGTAFADTRLNKDIAIALQGYYQRQNERFYGDEDTPQL